MSARPTPKPSRCYQPREWVLVVLLIMTPALILLVAMGTSSYAPTNAVDDWTDYFAANGTTVAGDASRVEVTEEATAVNLSTIGVGDELLGDVYLPNYQVEGMRRIVLRPNGTALSASKVYEFGGRRVINEWEVMQGLFRPLLLAGWPEDGIDFDTMAMAELIGDGCGQPPFTYVPANWTGFWSHFTCVYFWGDGDQAWGYRISNTSSASAADLRTAALPVAGGLTALVYDLDLGGELVPSCYQGTDCNRSDSPTVRSVRDLGVSNLVGTDINQYEFFINMMLSFAGGQLSGYQEQLIDDFLLTPKQFAGYYRHQARAATYCGFYVATDAGFNITQHFTPETNLPLYDVEGGYVNKTPADRVSVLEWNPFFGVRYDPGFIAQDLGLKMVAVVAGASLLLGLVSALPFPGEAAHKRLAAQACSRGVPLRQPNIARGR